MKRQSKVTILFGKDPKNQSGDPREQGSNATIIESDMNFLAINLWPKMKQDELLKIMSVYNTWGEHIVKKYFL